MPQQLTSEVSVLVSHSPLSCKRRRGITDESNLMEFGRWGLEVKAAQRSDVDQRIFPCAVNQGGLTFPGGCNTIV